MRAFYCAWATGIPCLDEALTLDNLFQSSYRLSHATTSAYRTHTSPVGHLEQFVLPTEPCDHADSVKITSVFSPCGRIVKLIDVWEQVPEALQLRGFQAFRFDRQAIYSCLHTGVHDRGVRLTQHVLVHACGFLIL